MTISHLDLKVEELGLLGIDSQAYPFLAVMGC